MQGDAKTIIVDIIEDLRRNIADGTVSNPSSCVPVFENLDIVEVKNSYGESLCITASLVFENFLNDYFKVNNINGFVVSVRSAGETYSDWHNYNIVKIEGYEPQLVDLTASQFFSKPLDVLGSPYFVGTCNELKTLVNKEIESTWRYIQENFSDESFEILWDLDYKIWTDFYFRSTFKDVLLEARQSTILLPSYYKGWEAIWGNQSILLGGFDNLNNKFKEAVYALPNIAKEKTLIPDFVSLASVYAGLPLSGRPTP